MSSLPYGGDINKAMQDRDRDAIKVIMAARNTAPKIQKEESKPAAPPTASSAAFASVSKRTGLHYFGGMV
jgi:hypothetical protein